DDDLRRGKPTSHKVYGEAIAILAGDALLTQAFEVVARAGDIRVVREVAEAAGAAGSGGGPGLDIESERKRASLEDLRRLHACKTGALIRASVRCGALTGGGTEGQIEALTRYGEHIGLAFQIADDILDVVGTPEALGKAVGADAAHEKSTYPGLVGLTQARELADRSVAAALEALEPFGSEADTFRELARYIVERDT